MVVAPAVGSRTFPVRVEQGRTTDLGVLQLEPPSKLSVRLTSADRARTSQLRVVAKNVVGDKFVSTRSDADGVARLRPLPPSDSKILVYGDAVAPVLLERALEPGQQWIDVEVQAANPVRMSFPFALSENPFLINGPRHVRVFDDEDRLVLDDYLGATVSRGRFVMAVGLPAGDYRVRARALWNALGEASFTVVDGQPTALEVPLRL